ncbi:MAG: phosphogluconate dehydrogenase [Rhizobiales bacterium 68-8]|nr:MAG: phosphogluconate dehydrogenase [Rhizobiales bacterium 68-8]
MSLSIGFIGFGEAARAFHQTLAAHDPGLRFCAYDILLGEPGMRAAIAGRGIEVAETPAALGDADWIVSAVTADQSLAAVEAIAPHLRAGRLVVDINSVSPGRKRASAALVEARGARYLDMAVMAPVHPRGHRTPVLIAGAAAAALEPELKRLDFSFRVAGEAVGAATAIKMVRSLFVKGLEAVTVECLLAARASGCFDEVYGSLARDFPGLGWPDFAAYEFERTLRHGRRRAAEMRESAATIAELGLNGALAAEIAEVQERMGAADAPPPKADALSDGIAAVVESRLGKAR